MATTKILPALALMLSLMVQALAQVAPPGPGSQGGGGSEDSSAGPGSQGGGGSEDSSEEYSVSFSFMEETESPEVPLLAAAAGDPHVWKISELENITGVVSAAVVGSALVLVIGAFIYRRSRGNANERPLSLEENADEV
ncbi:unnamed protein product [Heterosigma akashiwo]|eukprot:CAMPEP_0194570942 /NCGR_PEP_ID=MMETSP0292-20121207/8065_1 /TAXON_ID=39354 /ORGANISM="Heterosigma akashiwo, Strain CCMP2393" /LENGTH=138 /DNA_ID=CAMNT_0039421511 /DNA_START=34 /DNA_END=450 /DNA_ORIENTATION=-